MNSLIVDASVAVKWFVTEEASDKADEVSSRALRLLAPRFIMTEVANVLARKVTQGWIAVDEAVEYIAMLPRYLGLLDVDGLIAPALRNACRHNHPVYDFIYLEAARKEGTRLVTADAKFIARMKDSGFAKLVIPLAEWSA